MVGTITSVQESHFQYGFIGDCTKCPIALAMLSAGYPYPIVDYHNICYSNDYDEITKPMTKELKRKVDAIDSKKGVKPFKIIERKDNFSVYKGE